MPNLQLINVSGGSVILQKDGAITHQLPAGFSGQLNAAGTYVAFLGTSVDASVTNAAPRPLTNGLTYVTFSVTGDGTGNNTSFAGVSGSGSAPISLPEATRIAYGLNIANGQNNPQWYYTPELPVGVGSVVANFHNAGAPGNPTWWVSWTTNYYQQVSTVSTPSGTELGSFTVDTMSKSVTFHPETVATQTYGEESGWVALGFGLGLTVMLFRFMLRLLRAIPTFGGDF